jgi:hypothetical protein
LKTRFWQGKSGNIFTKSIDIIPLQVYNWDGQERDIMPDYLSITETAAKWGITSRRIALLCNQGRIPGAFKIATNWAIPANAEKPPDARIKSGKYVKPKEHDKK